MLAALVDKLQSLKENKIYEIDGKTYSDNGLTLIEPKRYSPSSIKVHGIESLVELIKTEIGMLNAPIFVEVSAYNKISVFSTYDDRFNRQELYMATSDVPEFSFDWTEYDKAIIAFRSRFIQNEGTEYILDLLSRISDENSVASTDNGISQTVEVKQGVSLKRKEEVKSRVALTPFRTFLEIEQPESEFLLRIKEGGMVGLFEADGGMWKQLAKERIYNRLKSGLCDLVIDKKVVVMY